MLDECGYTAMLQADRSAESAGRLENLAELARAMEEYDTLGDFLEHVSLVMDNDADREADKVTIMTIHAAKGLEFDTVFLAGWEEGVFPSQRALDEGGHAPASRRNAASPMSRSPARGGAAPSSTPPTAASTASGPARSPAASSPNCPRRMSTAKRTHDRRRSLWRANWSERADPFAHVAPRRRAAAPAGSAPCAAASSTATPAAA